ncbi:hypothetical protein Htur_4906 (plasmid) [Haloterrigena turkmenica DSM 5511]|uniref:Uncharacterized protein n=1 Tax=Haloterrigena turkmenica (strain ATCC 51198 / DSM 5511 / JCM 9101 / NCIMB 13204 / VKM B-1734 / 4k) TaxID=543526 RepID=D2S2P9_HALTV|nr:hypothetical protein [Haloterrigena turkmenica]ADB63646.1 hypothetical protein Htur_4906 [Haloterrigena turkmenica DSM 5511]
MTDDGDPFADLSETLDDDSDEQDDTKSDQAPTEPPTSDPTTEHVDESDEGDIEELDPMTDTAFSYEAANQRPFYAREETIEDFDSWLNYELERELNTRGYQNIVVREMTDALLRTVVEEDLVDEVAERFEQERKNAISK